MKTQPQVLTIGRSSIDLYSQNIGAAFEEIQGFDAFVGGSPLNIAVGCSRLGIKTSLLTAVGEDKVGSFILNFLNRENIDTSLIPTKANARSSAVVLGIEPPDRFPLVFYRDNAADSQIDIDDVLRAQVDSYEIVLLNGTALNKEPSRSACFLAAEIASKSKAQTLLDLDFRADQWHDYRAFGITIRSLLSHIDIAIGTEEEIMAATLRDKEAVSITHQQISSPTIKGDLYAAIDELLTLGPKVLIVKRGPRGASVYCKGEEPIEVPGFPVEILNTLGAGDAFASGFIYGLLQQWDWYKSCRMGNASGAQVVLQKGCANFMPTLKESLEFIKTHGGF